MCYPITDSLLVQILYQWASGYLWTRKYNVATSDIEPWWSIASTKYLARVENGDANNIAWTGWYGWGSTETVANVPSAVGMLLNVVRLAPTKYQLAFDYVTGSISTTTFVLVDQALSVNCGSLSQSTKSDISLYLK